MSSAHPLLDAVDVYERLVHQFGLHGMEGAILLPVLAVAMFVAGYTLARLILLAVMPGRVNAAEARRKGRT